MGGVRGGTVGTKERREREKENLRRVILDAARELFVTEGYEKVSMRKIADRIEYSPTTIYLYFEDKAAILTEICEETFAKLARRLELIRKKQPDPLERLREGCRAYIDFGLRHPNHYRVVFIDPIHGKPGGEDYVYEGSMGERAFGFLRLSVEDCAAAREIRTDDPELTSQVLWASLHGLTSLLITLREFPWAGKQRLIDHLIGTLIDGLRR